MGGCNESVGLSDDGGYVLVAGFNSFCSSRIYEVGGSGREPITT